MESHLDELRRVEPMNLIPATRLRRAVRLPLLLLAMAVAIAACGGGSSSSSSASGSKTPYELAFIGDLTGGNSGNSLGGQAGLNTAVKEINDSGGVSGHKLHITSYDSQSVVGTHAAVLRQALGSNPAAITGLWLSGSTAGSASIFASSNVPVVTASYIITGVDTIPYFFSTSPLASGVGAGVVNGLKSLFGGSLSGKKVAFEGLVSPAVDANLAATKSAVEAAGGSMGQVVRDPITFSSWSSQAANMVASKPNAVVINNTDPNTATVTKALLVAGFTGPMISTEGANSDDLLKSVDSSQFSVVRETVVPAPGSKLYKDAVAAGATPDQIAQSYFGKEYAAAYAIARALEKCGEGCTASKFTSSLKGLGKFTVPNDALAGPLAFKNSHSGLTSAQVWVWDNSKSTSVQKGSSFSIV
jgi:branched-chain amino acid transport system substrate-binding protein